MHRFSGRVWKLGDDVDTDQMAPFATLTSEWDAVRASMFPTRRDFVEGVREGDIVVAGRSFGCGSSREHAPENLKKLGVAAVVAESFGRIYFRNSVAIALPALACPGVHASVSEGDLIDVDLEKGTVRAPASGAELSGAAYSAEMLRILDGGGLLELLARRVQKGELP